MVCLNNNEELATVKQDCKNCRS